MRVVRPLLIGCLACGLAGVAIMRPRRIAPAQPLEVQQRPAAKQVPAPKASVIPAPPEQGKPWAAPATKLPKFLVAATQLLFEQGVADPRGCEYREVEVGDWGPIATHGFVLPAKPGEARRFAVGWDGVVYPATSIGDAADLEADMRGLADALKKAAEQPGGRRGFTGMNTLIGWSFGSKPRGPASVKDPSAVKVCMLLRLGRADLAETLFGAGTGWVPAPGRDLTDYHVSYKTLADEWANRLYDRAVDAHAQGDDEVALDAARRVSAFVEAAGIELKKRSVPHLERPGMMGHLQPYFPELTQLPEFLADQERRSAEPPRTPVPGPKAPAAERIAALIRDLDDLRSDGGMMMGVAHARGPALTALVKEGDAAVEPLLAVLESDNRLTRTVDQPRTGGRSIQHVFLTARNILTAILKTRVIPGESPTFWQNDPAARKRDAAAFRAFWVKNRGVSELELHYKILADENATHAQWLDAAEALAQPSDVTGRGGSYSINRQPGGKEPPPRGEPLRDRHDPGVTTLMALRVESLDPTELQQTARRGPTEIFAGQAANRMAVFLADWDLKGSLPTLKRRVARCAAMVKNSEESPQMYAGPEIDIATMTLLRLKGGDPKALDDYAAWIRTVTPRHGPLPREAFEPLWRNPDHPAIVAAAETLFADPKSPWASVPPPPDKNKPSPGSRAGLIATPMLGVASFRKLVLDDLADQTQVGSVVTDATGKIEVRFRLGSSFYESKEVLLSPKPGTTMPIRLADTYAATLQGLGGMPRFEYYWPEAKRDEVIVSCAKFLRQYGAQFGYREVARSLFEVELFRPRRQGAILAFDPLDHPATPADVRDGRAIFSLDAAESRLWPIPSFPLKARWTAMEIADDDPGLRGMVGAGKRPRGQVEMLQGGTVWQAEEVRENGKWRRYFGFVGPHVMARVPAEEIEFPAPWSTNWYPVSAEMEGRLIPPGGSDDGTRVVRGAVPPTGPLMFEVWLRNRRGIDSPVPADWVRTEGGPSLREGLNVRLLRVVDTPPKIGGPVYTPPVLEEVPARAIRRHRGGEPTATLAPSAAALVLRLDLRDVFPIEAGVHYRLEVTSDDLKTAEGQTCKMSEDFNTPRP